MSKAKLKKLLSTLSKEQVVDIMLQLYDASKEANACLSSILHPIAMQNLKSTKKQSAANSTDGMIGLKIQVSENAIN